MSRYKLLVSIPFNCILVNLVVLILFQLIYLGDGSMIRYVECNILSYREIEFERIIRKFRIKVSQSSCLCSRRQKLRR